ncbi:hypothetical protein IMSAG049_00579 [Clostridiales bacterium]|nr:hypothetical protein IMSAG049_00579 [Clostridiales bacterium]
MIKDCIQHHPDSHTVRLLNQRLHIRFIPEIRIDSFIISGIIFVIASGVKNRREVNPRNAQLPYIIQLICNPPQISSIKISTRHIFPVIPIAYLYALFSLIPSAEPVRHNLIPYRIFHPCRMAAYIQLIQPREPKILMHPSRHTHPLFCIKAVLQKIDLLLPLPEFKIILHPLKFQPKSHPPNIDILQFSFHLHPHRFSLPGRLSGTSCNIRILTNQADAGNILPCPNLNHHFIPIQSITIHESTSMADTIPSHTILHAFCISNAFRFSQYTCIILSLLI